MKVMGLSGVLSGKKVRTTVSSKENATHDLVNREFRAERPDQLWGADFTYVSTWQGFAYAVLVKVVAASVHLCGQRFPLWI